MNIDKEHQAIYCHGCARNYYILQAYIKRDAVSDVYKVGDAIMCRFCHCLLGYEKDAPEIFANVPEGEE